MHALKLLPALVLLASPAIGLAQGTSDHEGFYVSTAFSWATGDINQNATNGPFSRVTFSGAGQQLDFRVGGAVSRNNLLSFDMSFRDLSNPTTTVDGQDRALAGNASAYDLIMGVGFTHYFMPWNAFAAVTLGTGDFGLTNGSSTGTSKIGFGCIVRGGLEWQLGRRWGLGVVGGIAHLSASDKSYRAYPGYSATFTTTRVSLGLSCTFG